MLVAYYSKESDKLAADSLERIAEASERIAASLVSLCMVIEDASRLAEGNTLTLCETLREITGRGRK